MANLGLKVADVIKKFYDVQETDSVRGMYEVRKKGDANGDLLWYFFSSNNATYHSSGNDCVIRDINQTNSRYLDRLKAAFDKAKSENRKIFWLVLVYGEGIGLIPSELEWIASVELKVELDSITASLSMRTYPIGKGKSGEWEPCWRRVDQDKYFNTSFMSCKDETGVFSSKYMEPYFDMYDNRPYHDVVELKTEDDEERDDHRVSEGRNILFYGVPGAGKSYEIDRIIDKNRSERVVFHPDYTYSDFVGQILPRLIKSDENPGGKLQYVFVPGPFTKMLKKAYDDPDNMYYLVIEELNRGNAPAIFGDIFQLLDRDDDGAGKYTISNYDIADNVFDDENEMIRIPSNLTILATMNTSDQNVFTLDTAFQRRWEMHLIRNDVKGAEHAERKIEGSSISWGTFASVTNSEIIRFGEETGNSEDKRLGAYFARINELTKEKFPEKVLKYLWDDAFKMDHSAYFDESISSLDTVIDIFREDTSDQDILKRVIKYAVYSKMIEKTDSATNEDPAVEGDEGDVRE